MLSREIKQLLKLSKGKLIISEGSVRDSYIVMKLNNYLEEKEKENKNNIQIIGGLTKSKSQKTAQKNLTDQQLLDKINADIAELRQRQKESELEEIFANDFERIDYEYI